MSGRFIDTVTLGGRRRRRRMHKLLAELDRRDRDSALRLPPKPKTHRLGSAVIALVLLAGVTGIVLVARHSFGKHRVTASNAVAVDGEHSVFANNGVITVHARVNLKAPSPGVGEHHARLLPAPRPPAGSGDYTLLRTGPGVPGRYDPCRPIHYVVREQATPAGGDAAVQAAIAAVSKATGLKFIDDGTTTEVPSLKRLAYLPARYGDRWAPLLIAWTNPTEVPDLKGNVLGLGGSYTYSAGAGRALVSGSIFLDAPQLAGLEAVHGPAAIRAVVEHELGHVVGLGHVTDPTQIMYPDYNSATAYGAGDLRGLAYAGSGACHPEL